MTDHELPERQVVETLLYELFQNAPMAIGIREVRGNEIVHVEDNPCAAALFDRTPDQARGVSESELGVSRKQIERAIVRFRAARVADHPMTAELTVETTRGPRLLSGKVIALASLRRGFCPSRAESLRSRASSSSCGASSRSSACWRGGVAMGASPWRARRRRPLRER